MGSVTGTESDSTLKMRLTPIFALIILSCLLLNLTSAQRSASRKTSKNCRGPSSRPSSSRSSSSRPSSSRGSTRGRGSTGCRPNNQKPTTPRPTRPSGTLGSSRKPWKKLPKKKKNKPTSGTSDSSVAPTDEEGDSVLAIVEERDPVSSNKRIKGTAKKYLGKVKDKLQSAAIWFVGNKDKTIDDILVERWKEKCPGGASTKNKRKRCVSDALAESDDDTPEEKDMKDALRILLEEDSDGAYDFLSTSSSRTFGDIEKEEEIQDKLSEMPEKYEKLWEEEKSKTFSELESEFEREKTEKISKLPNDMKAIFSNLGRQISIKLQSWSSSCSKENRAIQSRRCQTTAGRDGEKKQKCRKAQATKRQSCLEEVFEVQEEDSIQDQNIKAELEELATQDLETGIQLVESCQIPENIRS